MEVQETIYVTESRVACDGGGGALGHPLVYLEMGEADEIFCPYCSRRFRREGAHAVAREAAAAGD